MWRISGNITSAIRTCVCRTPNHVSQKAGVGCNFCSKPSSTPAPGAPKPGPPASGTPKPGPPASGAPKPGPPASGAPKPGPLPPPPPSAPTPRKSGGAMKVILGGLLLGGGATAGTLAYAKANPEFRRQVESNWPILLDVFPYFFIDERTEAKGSTAPPKQDMTLGGSKKPLKAISPSKPVPDETTASPSQPELTKAVSKSSEPVLRSPAPMASQALAAELKKEEEKRKSIELEEKLLEQEIDEAANIAAFEAIIDDCMGNSVEATRIVLETNKLAVDATKTHTEKLKVAMGDSQDENSEMKKKQWDEVVVAAEAKLQAVTQASRDETAAREALAKLKAALEEAKQLTTRFGPNPRLIGAQENLNQMTYDLVSANAEVVKAQHEARILKNYHDLIEKSREEFRKELQSLMPEAKLGKKGKKMTEEELNSLIAHAHRRVYQLQRELAEQHAMEQQRLGGALEKQREEDDKFTRSKIMVELERQAADLAVLYQKKEEDLDQQAEQELRLQLRRQAAAHSDHLSDVLRQQEQDFDRQLLVQEGLVREQERDNYYQQLTGAMAKLRGVESAVEGRAGLELQNRKAQELWLACETLKRTIATGKLESQTWEEKLKPLANEIVAIREASPSNQFVDAIIKTIPEEALIRGVYTEDSLRQRWDQTKRVCRRIAMIEESGGSMFSYFLSYFQSLLVFNDPLPPNVEEDVDPATLDTFKLVAFASHHIENGNLEQALRYANQLTGMPRRVASDWLTEARLLLETSQAASVLSSHASASGLGGLHFH